MRRRRDQEGALSAEFVGILPLLLLIAIVGWQLLMVVGAGTSAATAARNGSRALSTGESAEAAATRSLPGWLRGSHRVVVSDPTVRVEVAVPLLFPGVTLDNLRISRSASLPRTAGDPWA